MRYLIDPEFRPRPAAPPLRVPQPPYAAALRAELSARNLVYAQEQGCLHEVSLGHPPAILYRPDDAGNHGNFLPASYRNIQAHPEWHRRLTKVHTTARRSLLSRDPHRCELDSSNSSDALLMNIFCHPKALTPSTCRLLGVDSLATPIFGYRPHIPLKNGRTDATEIDLRLGTLLIEAKLTEANFQTAPLRLIERYRDLEQAFNREDLALSVDAVSSYQLIRGTLAAFASPESRFCVLCDARRPDLIAAWHSLLCAVRPAELRCRLMVLTWQELAAALPVALQSWLACKYGILVSSP